MPEVVLYTRVGCHLCDQMKRVVEAVRGSIPFDFREIDVDSAEDLRRLYDHEVPVLVVDGRKAFKYRVSERDLRRYLQA